MAISDADLFRMVLDYGWQEPPAPLVNFVDYCKQYPQIHQYLKHWRSADFWDSVLNATIHYFAFAHRFEEVKSEIEATYPYIGAVGWWENARIKPRDHFIQGVVEYETNKNNFGSTVTWWDDTSKSYHVRVKLKRLGKWKPTRFRLVAHEGRHISQHIIGLPFTDKTVKSVSDLLPEEIDARFFQEVVYGLLNLDKSLSYDPVAFKCLYVMLNKIRAFDFSNGSLQNADVEWMKQGISEIKNLLAFLAHLHKSPGGTKPLNWIGSDHLYSTISLIWAIFSARENMTWNTDARMSRREQIDSLISQLHTAPSPRNNLFLTAALREQYAYLLARKTRLTADREEKEQFVKARFMLTTGALEACNFSRFFKYVAGVLYDYYEIIGDKSIRENAEIIFDHYYFMQSMPGKYIIGQKQMDYISKKFSKNSEFYKMFKYIGVSRIPSYDESPDFSISLVDSLLKRDENSGTKGFISDAMTAVYRMVQKQDASYLDITNQFINLSGNKHPFGDPFINFGDYSPLSLIASAPSIYYKCKMTVCMPWAEKGKDYVNCGKVGAMLHLPTPVQYAFIMVNIFFYLSHTGDEIITGLFPTGSHSTEDYLENFREWVTTLPLIDEQTSPA